MGAVSAVVSGGCKILNPIPPNYDKKLISHKSVCSL